MPTLSDGGSCGRAYRWGLSLEAGTSPEQPVVQVESVYVYNGLFHSCHCKRQEPNFRSALHRIAEAQRSVVNPSRGSLRRVATPKKGKSMKQWYLTAMLLVAFVANASSLENEDKAYGELGERIVERIRLWPGLAPHETESSPGRYAYDEKNKVWRRRDVSRPELVVFRPFGKPRDTMVIVMPGGGYSSQHMNHFCRDSRPILESGRWVAVLHYRIPRREGRNIYDAPREDAARVNARLSPHR